MKCVNSWECLEQLLEQGQFDLAEGEKFLAGGCSDCKVIYLLNDTVESFLVFQNARYTGAYIENYEDEISYILEKEQGFLRIDQGDSHFLLFFDGLELETQFYDYSRTGHFWVKGNEDLRNLEFLIAVIRDKLDYLGEETCSESERQIASLKNFPPLNYTCYPAVSMKYIVPMENPWKPTEEAIAFFLSLSREAEDRKLEKELEKYREHPTKRRAKKIAHMLTLAAHSSVTELLYQRLQEAGAAYPMRDFGEAMASEKEKKLEKAQELIKKSYKKCTTARVYVEEPFVCDCDDITLKVYVMLLEKGLFRRRVRVIEVE